jgi:CheY-like chemotaxis protein
MLAHDLRSPITGSERIVSMILDGLAGSITSKQQQLLSLVSGTNKNLLLMINNVLDAYRLEAGGEKFQMIRLNLSTIIAECMQDIEPIAQSKNIQLRSNLNCPHDVLADPLAMRRVITNLINNAIKFTPVGGCVEVIFEKQDGKASLKIKDNGIGIQPEKMPFLFERFYQADAQNRTAGLGIGLHLCKHLVNAQKGDISCKSDPASGSIFEVILPIAYDKSVRALIVDDNAANRMVLQQMLKHLKVGSVSVCSGIEALSATSNHSFDAIFMDLQMPGLDGFDTSKAMRDAGIDSPIVAYTGFGDFGPSSFGESGISDVMHKPVELTRVREIVEQWMR